MFVTLATPATPQDILDSLAAVLDPELGQSVVDLGLIYDVSVHSDGQVIVSMTLTTPHCPHASHILSEVRRTVLAQPGVAGTGVRLVWEPPWTPYRMARHLRSELGLPDWEPPPPQPGSSSARSRVRGWLHRLAGRSS